MRAILFLESRTMGFTNFTHRGSRHEGKAYQNNVGSSVKMRLRGTSSCHSEVVATHKGQGGHAALLLGAAAACLHLPAAGIKASSHGLQASPCK